MKNNQLHEIKEDIARMVGSKVKLEEALGRQRVEVTEGTVAGAYPSVFTVEVSESTIGTKEDFLVNTSVSHLVSFSYTELLTKDVLISLEES